MFCLVSEPLDSLIPTVEMAHRSAGGYVTFEGWVRDCNEGRSVLTLEYEAYESMAEKEGARILAEAKARFDILDACGLHRTGRLEVGEMAVWIGVTAVHRKAAFEACEAIIDAIKHRLPIWKKETYADGDSGWVNCQHHDDAHGHAVLEQSDFAGDELAENGLTEAAFYARQIRLPDVGPDGQDILRRAKVLVVGVGGLGNPALQSLAGAGVGMLGLCEPDRVQISNLPRQPLFSIEDVGQPKASVAAKRLQRLNPFIRFTIHAEALTIANAESLFQAYDLVLDCTDCFETKLVLSDTAARLEKPLVQAAIYQYEGQLRVYRPGAKSPCLRCLWPEPPAPDACGTCVEGGILGPTAGILGNLQALEALKLLLNLPGQLSGNQWLIADLLHYHVQTIRQPVNPACPTCGPHALSHLSDFPTSNPAPGESVLFPFQQFLGKVENAAGHWTLLDLCEGPEAAAWTPPSGPWETVRMPFSDFLKTQPVLDAARNYLLVCPSGRRSVYLAKMLRRQGWTSVFSLPGGLRGLGSVSTPAGV